MSWKTDLALAQARVAALETAEMKVLSGEQVKVVQYDGERLEFQQGATLSEIRRALYEANIYVTRLSGGCRTGGAIIPTFRG